jgi:hypothetical protein
MDRFLITDEARSGITFNRKPALKFVNGVFVTKFDDSQERDENGRWTSTGDTGGATEFPAAQIAAARERFDEASDKWEKLNDNSVNWIEMPDGNGMTVDRANNTPEVVAAWDERLAASAAVWGSAVEQGRYTEVITSVKGEFFEKNFATVDSEGNPTDPTVHPSFGADDKQFKIASDYVRDDEKTLAMNAALRDGTSTRGASIVDRWVNSQTLTNDVIVYRGAAMTQEQVDTLQPGFSYVDKGFQSSSYSEAVAQNYLDIRMKNDLGESAVMMRYVVESGTHMGNYIGEAVVQRNTTNTVVGRNVVDDVTYITMRVRGNG